MGTGTGRPAVSTRHAGTAGVEKCHRPR